MTIIILGRQPGLSLAELEAVYGASNVRPLGKDAALVKAEISPDKAAMLGGSIKVASLLSTKSTTDFKALTSFCRTTLPAHIKNIPDGKIRIGLSTHGLNAQSSQVNGACLDLKRIIKNCGRSVRTVPNSEAALSSAQVMHNKLTSPTGIEFLFVRDGSTTHIAQTTYVQDIIAYTLRDRGRPKRDAFVGMLPPKLAQIMINLAKKSDATSFEEHLKTSHATLEHDEAEDSSEKNSSVTRSPKRLLDPFCGTGVVLQEATLMGYEVYGTDISPKMVEYSAVNLQWLAETLHINIKSTIELGDATHYTWKSPIGVVVCEGYLGKPQRSTPTRDQLEILVAECDNIMRSFLKNIHDQLQPGTPLVVAVPAWNLGNQFRHLPLIQDVVELGYHRPPFTHALPDDLLYYREDQYVARELLVLIKK